MKHSLKFLPVIWLALALAACAVSGGNAPSAPTGTPTGVTLQAYKTATLIPSATLPAETATPLPSPTPTPRTHTVVKGELISSIALRYGLSSQQLLDANPGVDPNLLIAGTVLVIPAAAPTPEGFVPTSTPMAASIGAVKCHPAAEGGAWCFAEVSNPNPNALENVSALMRLADSSGNPLAPVIAYPPLNLLPAGDTLPLSVYLPAPLPVGLQASMELRTALPVSLEDTRYLPATLENSLVQILPGGLSAEISAEVQLGGSPEDRANQVWVAAMAYDATGNPVGVRRWESYIQTPGGGRLPLVMRVYSTAGAIARVELRAEARR